MSLADITAHEASTLLRTRQLSSRELTELLQPYMDVVSWDVRAVYEIKYDQAVDSFKKMARQAA